MLTVWLVWVLAVLAVLVVLIGIDRLMLAAERRGWIFYRHRKPTSGSMSSAAFGAMAEVMQPGRQVVVAEQQRQKVRRSESRAGQDQ